MSINSIEIKDTDPAWLRPLRDALRGLRYGSVEVVVHEGRVVQIERREKVRFDEAERRRPDGRGRDTTNERRTYRASGGTEPTKSEETDP